MLLASLCVLVAVYILYKSGGNPPSASAPRTSKFRGSTSYTSSWDTVDICTCDD